MNREQRLAEAFVGLADTLSDDFDPVGLLDRLAAHCVDLTGADQVGIMMATARGTLRTMAVTDDGAALFELFQSQTGQGPCMDCYRTGEPVDSADLGADTARWPRLAPLAVTAGYRAAHAVPLRVGHQTLGAVNVLLSAPGGLAAGELRLVQALADVAALALIHYNPEPTRSSDVLTRAESVLAAKAAVEMASGMLAEHGRLTPSEALRVLRAYCAGNGGRLSATAQALVRRELALTAVLIAVR